MCMHALIHPVPFYKMCVMKKYNHIWRGHSVLVSVMSHTDVP